MFAAHEARVTGLIELGAGRWAEAAEALAVAAEFALAGRLGDPVLFPWAANLTEALVRAGRRDQAARAYRAVIAEAERTGRPAQLALAARCRGLLAGSHDEARRAFDEALARHDEAGQPFELARTQLCYGELLRRDKRRVEARAPLGAALATFERLGAHFWAQRAEVELRAAGVRSRNRGISATDVLTSQELQVAHVVAEGLTNAEAATRLFLTPKTIEFHLSNAYRKLGLRSRAELVAWLTARTPRPRTGPDDLSAAPERADRVAGA
jgi:DNA-binding CsgD family transcriptional regulator